MAPERAAFLRLLQARQAEMQDMIDRILAHLEPDPPAPRRKRTPKAQQAALFPTETTP